MLFRHASLCALAMMIAVPGLQAQKARWGEEQPPTVPAPIPLGAPAPPAPLPSDLAVKTPTIMITNGGEDSGLFPHPFTGPERRVYDRLYADAAASKAVKVKTDEDVANLILQVELVAPAGAKNPDKTDGFADPVPEIRLSIYHHDGVNPGRPQLLVWRISKPVEGAISQKTHDANLDYAIDAAFAEFLTLIPQP